MFQKFITFLAGHVAAVLAPAPPATPSAPSPSETAAQQAFDAAKPFLKNAIDQVADQLAAEVDAKGAAGISDILSTLNGKIGGMGIPAYVKIGLELAIATANLTPDRVAPKGLGYGGTSVIMDLSNYPLPHRPLRQPTPAFPYVTMAVDIPTLLAVTRNLIAAGVSYHLGAKAPSLGCDTSKIEQLDCSGFAEYALYRATAIAPQRVETHVVGYTGTDIQEGSVNEHDWCDGKGFKKSSPDACTAKDGVLRIAFLSPDATSEHIGHVMLVLNGQTLESHGGVGVDRRAWDLDAHPWMTKCTVYVLTPPP